MILKCKRNIILCLFFCLLLLPVFPVSAAPLIQDIGEHLVIVIDPGHGGINEGTIAGEYPEKEMTLISAQAMYEELMQFDHVEVHMTRTEDVDLSLKERAEFAASVNADFLFSIHYNASEYHTLFGSEVWVSCQPPYNAYGYQFGYKQMQEMEDMGLFLRGIKTRLNDEGTDYYGIIREAAERNVPAVIIEHCHVDEARDLPYCDTREDWIAFGQANARAVAKYFGLTSTKLGIDYSEEGNNLPEADENKRVPSTLRDETSPDVCMIELINANFATGEIEIKVTATDYDSPLMYYDYSIDGGTTYCPLKPWPQFNVLQGTYADTFTLFVQAEEGKQPEIIVRAYNLADLYTVSNSIPILQTFYAEAPQKEDAVSNSNSSDIPIAERDRHSIGTTTFVPAGTNDLTEKDEDVSIFTFLKICLLFVIVLFGIVLTIQSIRYKQRKMRRRQHRNDAGKSQYHNK